MNKILLIEPDRLLAESYKLALEAVGYQVTPVSGAQAGIMAIDQQRPDAIVLELQLIGHSGIEFLYELRSYPEWNGIPVIVQSQVPVAEFAGNWQILQTELGVQAYLYKPQTSLAGLVGKLKGLAPLLA
jgi:DNA-binding response OmpR family regulator